MTAAAARHRHPSTQAPVPPTRVALRVASLLDRPGVRWPRVAAAVLQLRGTSGLSPDEFAALLGVHADVVRSAEAGEVDADDLPESLRRQVRALLLDADPRWSA